MLPEVETLLRIQHQDQAVKAIVKELANIPQVANEIRDRLEGNRAIVESAKQKMQQTEIAIREIELDVKTRRDSVSKMKALQYETRKNEEYQRLSGEIERYQGEISRLEDRQIEMMEIADAQRMSLEEARRILKESEVEVEKDLADLEILAKKKEEERHSIIAERNPLASRIDTTVLDGYERLFRSKNGQAVVGLVDGVCQGCFVRVVKSTIVSVKAEKQIAHCENCGRILYWWTDESEEKD